jgi:hypothetical protein
MEESGRLMKTDWRFIFKPTKRDTVVEADQTVWLTKNQQRFKRPV